ncbi:hypothetical protein TNCV_1299991 [Trichonephila clavipes]|nr:hypothetical protein TNCV_1299991 [Trichonephila clavipes]
MTGAVPTPISDLKVLRMRGDRYQWPNSTFAYIQTEMILRHVLLGKMKLVQYLRKQEKGKPRRFDTLRCSNTDFPKDSYTFSQPGIQIGLYTLTPTVTYQDFR